MRQHHALLVDTWRGILAPRRLLPILLVSLPMILAEGWFTQSWSGVFAALVMVLVFLMTGPFSWRLLLGNDQAVTPARLGLFVLFSGALPTLSWLGYAAGLGAYSYIHDDISGLIIVGLVITGSWGIGRDIDMEQGIAAARERAAQLAQEAERAQLMALRAHLDPHFLFNTLNAIAEWCREDGEVAEAAVLKLSALLREVMAGVKTPFWALSREQSLIEDLWSLHQIRDPDRFSVELDLPDSPLAVSLPSMVLLPLAENAVKHGPAAGHRGPLRFSIQQSAVNRVTITISNPGPYPGPREGGEGLPMVHKRLALSYDDRARLEIREEAGRTVAVVTLPLSPQEDA